MRKIRLLFFFLMLVQLGFSSEWIQKTKIPMTKDDYNALDVKIMSKDLIFASNRDTIWFTTDIGNTWQYLNLPDSVEYINDFFVQNPMKLWVSTSEGLYNSDDYGNTWNFKNSSRFSTIHFINDSIGFGCKYNSSTSNHSIFKTEDKGQTWKVVYNAYSISSFTDIQFLGDKIGYAIGNTIGSDDIGHIYKTVNYGNSWQEVSFPSSANNNKGYYSSFRTLFICDYYNVFAGGYQLIKSNNTGTDWTEIYDNNLSNPRSIVVNDLYFFNDTLGYFSNYSSSPQRLYKLVNDDFDMWTSEISTSEGTLDFDFNNNIGIAFAVSANGNCWADTTIEQNNNAYYGLVSNKNEIDFELSVCESQNQSFLLSNNGTSLITIDSITHNSEYTISLDNSIALYPQESINITVTFSPSKTGIYQDNLNVYANSAITPFTILLQNNVDSIAFNNMENLSICSGDSLLWHGSYYNEQGEYSISYKTILGCDSIYNLSLTVNTINTNIDINESTLTTIETGADYQWINCSDFSIIGGENSQSFQTNTNGNYAVIISKNNCVDTTDCILVDTHTNLINNTEINNIQVYPNPIKEYLTVDGTILALDIFDLKGVLIKSISIKNSNTIYLGDLQNGVYFAKFYTSENSINKKIIIEK